MTALASQRVKAAALAKVRAPFVDAQGRAKKIAVSVAPSLITTIAAAIATDLETLRGERVQRQKRDIAMEDACHAVGEAVDRLLQAKYTPAEPRARIALEKAAMRLRALIVKRGRA